VPISISALSKKPYETYVYGKRCKVGNGKAFHGTGGIGERVPLVVLKRKVLRTFE